MKEPDKADGILFNDKAQAVVTHSDAVVIALGL
jgi:hypothetical protein